MKKAVILFNLGGPDKLENVEPFLFNLFNDKAILNLPGFFRYPLAKLIANRRAPIAKKIYKTEIQLFPEGDTFFPDYRSDEWSEVSRENFPAQSKSVAFSYVQLDRLDKAR